MPNPRTHLIIYRILVIALLGWSLAACSRGTPVAATPTAPAGETGAAPADAATPAPSETPVVSAAVILVAPPEADPALTESLRAVVAELATSANLGWEERPALNAADLSAATQIVVGAPGVDLVDLAGAVTQTYFVMVGAQPFATPQNLTGLAMPAEDEAFLAGYVAAITSTEWRSGIITSSGASAYRDAFLNGAYYLCGLCIPKYPPYANYPVAAEAADGTAVAAALQAFASQGVETVFIEPGLLAAGGWDALAQNQMKFITPAGAAVPDGLAGRRVASVQFDPAQALRDIWPGLLAGESQPGIRVGVLASDVLPDLLSAGRLRLVAETAAGLQSGAISPDVVPVQ